MVVQGPRLKSPFFWTLLFHPLLSLAFYILSEGDRYPPPQQTITCASFNLTVIRGEIRDILLLLLPLSGPVRTFLLTFSFGSNRFILFAVKIEEVEIFFISFYCSCGDKLWEILLLLIALHHWAKPTVANPVNKAVDSEKHSKPFFFKNI